jgi:hypothetical protein
MVKLIRRAKKRAGRPATGLGLGVQVRFPPHELELLDDWIRRDGGLLSRPQAIRRLVAAALKQRAN